MQQLLIICINMNIRHCMMFVIPMDCTKKLKKSRLQCYRLCWYVICTTTCIHIQHHTLFYKIKDRLQRRCLTTYYNLDLQ